MRSRTRIGSGRTHGGRAAAETLIVLAALGWWLTARGLPATVFPSPLNVTVELGRLAVDRTFWANAAVTGTRVLAAVLAATVLGTLLALVPRYASWARGILDDILIPFFNSFPAIAWAILGSV